MAFGTNISTPLLLVYEDRLGLSTWTVTALFAIYPLGLLPALVYAGPASDSIGRRPVVTIGAVLSLVAAVVMIAGQHSLALLLLGRFLLGAVSGMVFVVASAWMQELMRGDPMWAARLTTLALYAGFGAGPLISGALGEWVRWPLVLPYAVQILVVLAGLGALARVPETVVPDRHRAIRPRLGIPPGARRTFATIIAPTALGVFGFPSLAFGLFPVLLRPEMASIAVFVTGIVGLLTMGSIVPAQLAVGRLGALRAAPLGIALGTAGCAVGVIALLSGVWQLLFISSVLMGGASGFSMTAGLRMVDAITSVADRGALIGSFYALAYAGMAMPLVVSSASLLVGGLDMTAVLAIVTSIGLVLAGWLGVATRRYGDLIARRSL